MTYSVLPVVAALLAAAAVLIGEWTKRVVYPWYKQARVYARAMGECGHLGDEPSDKDVAFMLRFAAFFVRHFVGEVRVIGAEKLKNAKGPFLLSFNHGNLLDVAIAPVVLGRKARYPAAQGVMRAFGGWVGWLFGRWGVFAVDLDNGAAALEASVKVMDNGEIEVLFPEAWTHMDGHIGKFKTGAVRIVKRVAAETGKRVGIMPGYMRYHKYPGSWITKLPIPIQWMIPLLFPFYYGRGCTVVIGEMIWSDELPEDIHEATEYFKQRIMALDPGLGCANVRKDSK